MKAEWKTTTVAPVGACETTSAVGSRASPRSTTGGSRRATPTAAVSGRSVRPDRVTRGPPASGRPHRRSRRLERCRSLSAGRCPADAPARGLGRAPGSRSVGGCWARQRTGLRSGRRTDRVRGTGRRSRQPRSGRAAPKTSEDGKQDRAPSHLVGLRSARRSRSMTSSRLWRTNERNDPQSAPMPPRNRTAANNRLGCRWGGGTPSSSHTRSRSPATPSANRSYSFCLAPPGWRTPGRHASFRLFAPAEATWTRRHDRGPRFVNRRSNLAAPVSRSGLQGLEPVGDDLNVGGRGRLPRRARRLDVDGAGALGVPE
jgi:hypothetical protein